MGTQRRQQALVRKANPLRGSVPTLPSRWQQSVRRRGGPGWRCSIRIGAVAAACLLLPSPPAQSQNAAEAETPRPFSSKAVAAWLQSELKSRKFERAALQSLQREAESLAFVAGVLLLGGGLFWVSFQVPEAIVRDSPKFRQSLEDWHRVIMTRCRTPRSVKRFMNRLRFFAMRQRSQTQDPSHSQYVIGWIRTRLGREPARRQFPGDAPAMDESLLVAICALHLFEPRFILDQEEWSNLCEGLSLRPTFMKEEDYELLKSTIEREAASNGWSLTSEHRELLTRMFAEIRLTD